MNILKSIQNVDSTFLAKSFFALKLSRFFDDLMLHGNRFFTSERVGRQVVLSPRRNAIEGLHAIQTLHPLLPPELSKMLMSLRETRKFHATHRQSMLTFAYLDLVLVAHSIRTATTHREDLLNYLCFHAGEGVRKEFEQGLHRQKSNLHMANVDSSIFYLDSNGKNRRTTKVWLSNQDLILACPLLSFIEISSGVDNSKLADFLQALKTIGHNTIARVQKNGGQVSVGQKFGLRIRKIRHTHKKGLFMKAQNTIVVDPRHTESLAHEVGHWYHTHFEPQIVSVEEAEDFAERFSEQVMKTF